MSFACTFAHTHPFHKPPLLDPPLILLLILSFIVHRESIEEPNHEYEDANESGAENPTGSAVDSEDLANSIYGCIQNRHVKIYDVSRTFQLERDTLATEKHHECAPHVSTAHILPVVGCRQEVPVCQCAPNIPIVGYERALDYERVPDVNLAQILSTAGTYERVPDVNFAQILSTAGTYERVPDVNLTQILSTAGIYERAQTYERVPNVDIAQILAIAGGYERAQTYERVPNVDIAQILAIAGGYEKAQGYEQVPNILPAAQIYERVPNLDITQILSQIASSSSGTEHECVQHA